MKKLITLCLLLSFFGAGAQTCVPNSNSLGFNGTTNWVDFTTQNNLSPTNAVTVEAWVLAAGWGTNPFDGSIFCKHSGFSSAGLSGYAIRAGANGTLSFVMGGDSAGVIAWKEVLSPSGTIALNTWTHVAATFDGTIIKIYKNGIALSNLPFNGIINPSPFTPKIGHFSDSLALAQGSGPRLWNGKIDEVRVWNRALTQAEIADSMSVQITPSAQTGLIGYWNFNEGTGMTINDLSTSGNTGTAQGNTWSASVPFNNAPPVPIVTFTGTQLYVVNSCPNYQWYLDGNIIPGATGQVYNPSQNGTYTVVDTNAYCISTSAPTVLTTLSINENELSKLISLSPNPVSDVLRIHLSDNVFSTVDITDIAGRTISHYTKAGSDLKIDVAEFAKGVYLARFSGNSGVTTKKFVVE